MTKTKTKVKYNRIRQKLKTYIKFYCKCRHRLRVATTF